MGTVIHQKPMLITSWGAFAIQVPANVSAMITKYLPRWSRARPLKRYKVPNTSIKACLVDQGVL